MTRLDTLFKEHWTERIPEPLNMTDTEMLNWMDEYCESAVIEGKDWKVKGWGFEAKANLLRNAICLAAAYHHEANNG